MDPAYGNDSKLRAGISELGLTYVAGIMPTTMVWRPGEAALPPASTQAAAGPASGCDVTRRINLCRPRHWLWSSTPTPGNDQMARRQQHAAELAVCALAGAPGP